MTPLPREMRRVRAAEPEIRARCRRVSERSGSLGGERTMCNKGRGGAGARSCGMVVLDWVGARDQFAAPAGNHLHLARPPAPRMRMRISALRVIPVAPGR